MKFTCIIVALLTVAAAHGVRAAEVEFKFLVNKMDTASALAKVKSKLHDIAPQEVDVCFFDTPDGDLQKAGIILRAREKKDEKDDSTLKLRAADDAPAQKPLASALPVEQDWTSLDKVNHSRSMDDKGLKKDLFDEVMDGTKPPKDLFKKQKELLQEQKPGFNTDTLKRHGPIKTNVWKKALQITGFDGKVTVEHWILKKQDAEREVLEFSAKVEADSAEDIRARAKSFYDAIEAAQYGSSEQVSKTQLVLDFFKPGN